MVFWNVMWVMLDTLREKRLQIKRILENETGRDAGDILES